MHHNDWLQRNKVIKPCTARSGMQAAGTKTPKYSLLPTNKQSVQKH